MAARLGGRDGCNGAVDPGHVSIRAPSVEEVMSLFLCVELKRDGDGDVIIVADALKVFPISFELPCWCSLGWSGTRSQGLIACSIEGGGEGTC